MLRVVFLFAIFAIAFGQTTEILRNLTEIKKFVDDYRDKICKSEKTCHLTDMVSESLRTLRERNCMCDSDCTLYEDCCEDSIYINKHDISHRSQPFHCPEIEKVYMKTSCPANYTVKSVKGKCESSVGPLKSENEKLFIPVTNIAKNITYGNEYCAICNNDYHYVVWGLIPHCSMVYEPPKIEPTQLPNSENNTENNGISSTTEFVDHYYLDLEEAKNYIKFNPANKTFYSKYNGKLFECWYTRRIPDGLLPHLRDCVPYISTCSIKNETLSRLCKSYTSIVYDEGKKTYKNKDCAHCNNVTTNLVGCANPPDTRITGSSLFTTKDKGNNPPCGNAKLKDKFCT